MTTLFAPSRTSELRAWVNVARELRRQGVDASVRSAPAIAGAARGDLAFAHEVLPRRWILGLVDARGTGAETADVGRAVAEHLRDRSRAVRELPVLLANANDFLRAEAPGRLVATTLISLDAPRHTVRIALAGSVTPVAVGRSGDVVALGERGPALGLVDEARWRETGPIRLAPGHLLLAPSDGIVERVREDGASFGLWRVGETMRALRESRPRQVVRALLDRVAHFGDEEGGDCTALALRLA
jgi:serine phosphatase RsbU (regulator of sigma subunit)